MNTITGDHSRSVLDDNSGEPIMTEKPAKIRPKLNSNVQSKRAQTVKTNDNQSWVDVVKSRPRTGLKGAPKSLLKR
jgi:hypothetical protein